MLADEVNDSMIIAELGLVVECSRHVDKAHLVSTVFAPALSGKRGAKLPYLRALKVIFQGNICEIVKLCDKSCTDNGACRLLGCPTSTVHRRAAARTRGS